MVRFPNNEAIFLHDTPSQGYFSQNMRALSSGCVRLQEAPELAHKLLAVSKTDAASTLEQLLSTGVTQELFLDQPIPVLLAYWTVDTDAKMRLHFRSDIYELDEPMLDFFKDLAAFPDRQYLP
ncbi:L,D-transpeptidase family protein [Nitrincola sp. A-D6]|uniref:L,D-transpeptidase family protein n=1 Tax=Nitrincola sp. A-D6 TaxID=1545442 RepID=UPI00068ABE1D|nr:L,D-transpeptidase family protein [Nitrincola sp. A-D6]